MLNCQAQACLDQIKVSLNGDIVSVSPSLPLGCLLSARGFSLVSVSSSFPSSSFFSEQRGSAEAKVEWFNSRKKE